LRLYRFKGEFIADENCKAWLLRVTVNLSKNLLKSGWFTKRGELSEDIPSADREDLGLIESVMSLPPKYRAVIHLYYYEGYSVKEIADILGISPENVRKRLQHGRKYLKHEIERNDPHGT
jgi:RNA polymerase sigma-70 factor (ECF subfamily)